METTEEKVYKFSAKIEDISYNFSVTGCNSVVEAEDKLIKHLTSVVEQLTKLK